jgi:hypothetical protein
MFNTPILFLIYNRPDTTAKVFAKIRDIRPKVLFVAADGPNMERVGDIDLCSETRNMVINNIDWECEIRTLFRDNNLGCGKAPYEAISWFFENVEEGIILEDDCLPSSSFFIFCSELLKKFRDDQKIMIISGFNCLGSFEQAGSDYFFTKLAGIWGWASWKRAWSQYKFEVPEWQNPAIQNSVLQSLRSISDRTNLKLHLDKIVQNKSNDFWDYQWWFYRLLNDGIGIVPVKNLIQNIGFGNAATHTLQQDHFLATLRAEELNFPLSHPIIFLRNEFYESILELQTYQGGIKRIEVSKTNIIKLGKEKLRSLIKLFNGK